MSMQGQRILFIGPRTFGYENEIQAEIRRSGGKVVWYDDRPASISLVKALIRTYPALLAPLSDAYFDGILNREEGNQYDVVFIIKGEALSLQRLQRFRNSQKDARFIYYTWDSLKNFKNSHEKLLLFDKAYSFDRFNCLLEPRVKHLPLFYTRAYEWRVSTMNERDLRRDIDLLFLGSLHSDRYSVVHNIWRSAKASAPDENLRTHFYYQSRWVFLLRKIFDKEFAKIPWRDVEWLPLDTKRALSLNARSKVLIDVHHPLQTGLTMRTIEALGMQRKIITTNQDVENYDFYRPENILTVERSCPTISKEFLMEPYKTLDEEIYRRYSLREWLKEIFSK